MSKCTFYRVANVIKYCFIAEIEEVDVPFWPKYINKDIFSCFRNSNLLPFSLFFYFGSNFPQHTSKKRLLSILKNLYLLLLNLLTFRLQFEDCVWVLKHKRYGVTGELISYLLYMLSVFMLLLC